ncbi:MAG: hypothetical protein ABJO67_17620 [Pseudoruegeria sp.]
MDYFAHRIHKAEMANGVVRLELAVMQPDAQGNYDPERPVKPEEVTFSVNIPLGGFVRSMGTMRELMQDLQQKGVLKGPEGEQNQGGGQQGRGGPQGRPQGGPGGPQGGPQRGRAGMRDITKDDGSDEQLV